MDCALRVYTRTRRIVIKLLNSLPIDIEGWTQHSVFFREYETFLGNFYITLRCVNKWKRHLVLTLRKSNLKNFNYLIFKIITSLATLGRDEYTSPLAPLGRGKFFGLSYTRCIIYICGYRFSSKAEPISVFIVFRVMVNRYTQT